MTLNRKKNINDYSKNMVR